MTENQSFTPKDVSELLEIPPRTLRRYLNLYDQYFSPDALKKSKNSRFSDLDIMTLKKIREMTSTRKTQDEINATLKEMQVIDSQDRIDTETLTKDLATRADNERLTKVLAILDQFRQDRIEDQKVISQLQDRLDRLERDIEFYNLPFFKKFGRKPPSWSDPKKTEN